MNPVDPCQGHLPAPCLHCEPPAFPAGHQILSFSSAHTEEEIHSSSHTRRGPPAFTHCTLTSPTASTFPTSTLFSLHCLPTCCALWNILPSPACLCSLTVTCSELLLSCNPSLFPLQVILLSPYSFWQFCLRRSGVPMIVCFPGWSITSPQASFVCFVQHWVPGLKAGPGVGGHC